MNVYLIPFFIYLAGSFFLQWLASQVTAQWGKVFVYAAAGIVIAGAIYMLIVNSQRGLGIRPMSWGGAKSAVLGFIVGLGVSIASGVSYGLLNGYHIVFGNIFSDLLNNIFANLYQALAEEITFRGGIVHSAAQVIGFFPSILAGAIPFGLLHILGNLFGNPVDPIQIVGITLAGVMLGLIYLEYGIAGSFMCHLTWNSLVGGWVKTYGIADKEIVNKLEGAWTTDVVLAIAILLLLFLRKVKREQKESE